jgi:GT2 family glycosyltransferase
MKYINSIAVLLTCHNRKEKTLCCLHNLFACPLPESYELHVYLVDDGSTDGTAEGVMDNFPDIKIIQGDGNLFWNRGMNLAWKTAAKERDYDFYLWLNDDTNLYPNALTELLETSEIKNNESIICGSTCATNNKESITYGGIDFGYPNNYILLVPNGKIQESCTFTGNIVLIPKYIFKNVGLNDAFFCHGMGDLDYGLRARKIGLKSFISPNLLGECDNDYGTWSDYANKENIYSRWKYAHCPKGPYPKETFYFAKLHFGIWPAIRGLIHVYVRILLPIKLRIYIERILQKTS